MTIKNPREYDIVGITGSRVGTLAKVTPKYFMDTSGVKYLRDYIGGAYSIVKKGSIQQAGSQGQGWREKADHTGKAPIHKAVATKNKLSTISRTPMETDSKQKLSGTLTLYHGTCEENAKHLIEYGWLSAEGHSGGNVGQSKYLYLSSGKEDALWFAEEKGCSSVVIVSDIPITYLEPDPEDSEGYSLEEQLEFLKKSDYPQKFVLTKPLDKSHFKLIQIKL